MFITVFHIQCLSLCFLSSVYQCVSYPVFIKQVSYPVFINAFSIQYLSECFISSFYQCVAYPVFFSVSNGVFISLFPIQCQRVDLTAIHRNLFHSLHKVLVTILYHFRLSTLHRHPVVKVNSFLNYSYVFLTTSTCATFFIWLVKDSPCSGVSRTFTYRGRNWIICQSLPKTFKKMSRTPTPREGNKSVTHRKEEK